MKLRSLDFLSRIIGAKIAGFLFFVSFLISPKGMISRQKDFISYIVIFLFLTDFFLIK